MKISSGLDRVIEDPACLAGRRWALLSNQASVCSDLEPARLALARKVGAPELLLAPEHGLDGIAQDMESVGDDLDPLTGVRVRSLYRDSALSLAPCAEDLEGIDVVVVDLQDIGCRYYTFAATMDGLMRVAEAAGIEVLVLDRPNPLGGIHREGGLVAAGFESFVSGIPVPIRHGLSLGEIALLLQAQRYPELELSVIPCRGWTRELFSPETGLPWVAPSPNMPQFETAVIYPGLCLIEATNLSEGRGTTRPFHLVGAPWLRVRETLLRLRDLDPPGIAFRPARFRPEFQKFASEICNGIEIHVREARRVDALSLGLELLRILRDLHPEHFSWRAEAYEFIEDIPAIDLLTGSAEARKIIETGGSFEPLFARWESERRRFEEGLERRLLYGKRRQSSLP